MMAANKANEQDVVVVDESGDERDSPQTVAKITGSKRVAEAAAGDGGVASSKKAKAGEKVHSAAACGAMADAAKAAAARHASGATGGDAACMSMAMAMSAFLRWSAGDLGRETVETEDDARVRPVRLSLRTLVSVRGACVAWRDAVDSSWSPADLLEHQLRRGYRGNFGTGHGTAFSAARWARLLDPAWLAMAMEHGAESIQARGDAAVRRLCATVAAVAPAPPFTPQAPPPDTDVISKDDMARRLALCDATEVADWLAEFTPRSGDPLILDPYADAIAACASPDVGSQLRQALASGAIGVGGGSINIAAVRALMAVGLYMDDVFSNRCRALFVAEDTRDIARLAAIDMELGILLPEQRRELMALAVGMGSGILADIHHERVIGSTVVSGLKCARVLMRAGWEFTDEALVAGAAAGPEPFFDWIKKKRPVIHVVGDKVLETPLALPYPKHIADLFSEHAQRLGRLVCVFARVE